MEDLLAPKEACKYLKMLRVTLYRHVRNGVIPAFKVGGAWKFHKISLEEWIYKRVREDTKKRSLLKFKSRYIKSATTPKFT